MACSREADVVYSLHGGGSQEVTAWYCEESRYVVFVFQMIPLNRSQRQAHPCSAKRHGYDLPRVTFVRLSRKPNGSTGVSSYLGSERHVAPLQKPNGPTGVSSIDVALARRPRTGSGYLRRMDGVAKP